MKHWYVYLLECSDKSLYCGATNSILDRVITHNTGRGAKYTKARRPVHLVYSESAYNKSEALKREHAIKKMTRRQKLEMIREAKKQ